MKGFYIYENNVFPKKTDCLSLHDVSHVCKLTGWADPEVTIDGGITKKTYAQCSKKDKYDFEVGALISLMKMCGKEKTEKAYLETFFKGGDPGDCPYYQVCKDPTIKRLEGEVEQLKLDNEKLKKGYSAGLGRVVNINGVNYRECDERGRVVWMTSQPESFSFLADYIDTDTINTLKEWYKKPVSKREQMWDDILKEGRTPVYVKREDIIDFLEECQVAGIMWSSGKLPLDTRPLHMSVGYEGVYFFIMTTLDISKTKRGSKKFRHVMSWWCTACPDEAEAAIHYIRPMRWDLFEKGRVYIRVKAEHFDEFQKACKAHLECGKAPLSPFHYYSNGDVIVCYIDEHFRLTKTLNGFKKRPVVNWEDVR